MTHPKTYSDTEEFHFYKELIDNLPGIFFMFNRDGRYLLWNKTLSILTGFTDEDMKSAHPSDFFNIEDFELVQQRIDKVFSEGQAEVDVPIKTKSGTLIPYHFSATRTVYKGETCIFGIGTDVSVKFQQAELLEQSENRFRALVQEGSDLIAILDENGLYKYVSPTSQTVLGIAPEEFIGKNAFDFIHPDDRDRVLAEFTSITTSKRVDIQPFRFLHKDGTWHWIETIATNLFDEPGVEGIVANSRDVTRQVEMYNKLAESELRYRGFYDSQTNFVLRTDMLGNYTYVNKKFIEEFGWIYADTEIIGQNCMPSICEYDWEKVTRVVENCIASPGQVIKVEIDKPARDGGKVTTLWDFICLTDAKGSPSEIQCMGIDITIRKKMEEELIALQSLLNNATKLSRVGGWSVDVENDVHYWSPMTREIHEVDEDFVPTLERAINFYDPEYRDQVVKYVENAVQAGKSFDFEVPIITAKGNRVWVRAIGSAETKDGIVTRLSGSFQDIDRQKTSELALESALQERSDILESIGDAFFAVDHDWIVTYWNKEAENVLFRKRDEILGKNLWEVYADAKHLDFYVKYHEAMETGETVIFVEHYPTLNKWFEVSAYPSKDGLSIYFKDISIRVHAEEQIRASNEQLKKYVDALSRSNQELEQFAYIASHDLQEPLRMITSFLKLLESRYKDKLDEKAKKYIHFAVDGAIRMRRIILNLLEYSRVTVKPEILESVKLTDVIDEVLLLHRHTIKEKNATIEIDTLPDVIANRIYMVQVFQNLLSNALRYSKPDVPVQISIRAAELEKEWQFSLSDNGIGIEKEFLDKVFIMFHRLHTQEELAGSGIGLSIVKKAIEGYGGRVWVESELGVGSTFYFTIPKKTLH